jgi:hypothetical protein
VGYQASDGTDLVLRGYACDTVNGVTCQNGTCVALVAIGGSCRLSDDCVRSAYCSYSSDVCTAKVDVGGACTSWECVDSAYCDTTAKKCTSKLANGSTCTSSIVCLSDYCTNNTCQGSTNMALSFLCDY